MKKMLRRIVESLVGSVNHKLLNMEIMPLGIDLPRDIQKNTPLESIQTLFDIGANVGQTASQFRRQFKMATVYSFEPISRTFKQLIANVEKDGAIKPFNIGFSDKSGVFKVFLQKDSGLNSINEKINTPQETGQHSEEINISTVDEFCAAHNIHKIDILKTDTEGLDLKVLQGAEKLISQGKITYILVEVGFNDDNVRNTPFEEVRKHLFQRGYRLRGIYDQSDYWNKKGMETANALFFYQHS
ncbi:MAG: FkbM family methyltransferase [Flavobacteriales bacterium]|jgi:FkbM family methyltransferase